MIDVLILFDKSILFCVVFFRENEKIGALIANLKK